MAQSIPDLIKKNEIDTLKDILSSNPELANGKTERGLSYLQLAAYYRNPEAIALICEKKKYIDLYEASAIGDIDIVQQHISAKPKEINFYSTDGFTALGLACYFGNFELVKYLVGNGADVNKASFNSFRVAPIHSATAISNYEITAFLLERGANVNAKQQSGVTPLHSAGHNGQTKLAELLIDHGADVNAKTDDGKTPVDMALEKGYSETAAFIKSFAEK